MKKIRIFVSFSHIDIKHAEEFMGLSQIQENFEFRNHLMYKRIFEENVFFVCKLILEEYIRPASVTVVLLGESTSSSSWVKWHISESVSQGKPIIGIRLRNQWGPTPAGLNQDTIGAWIPHKFPEWIEQAHKGNS